LATYLVVDDSATIRMTLTRILRAVDPEAPIILEAATGAKAIQLFDAHAVDTVFLDIHLGDTPGNVVLREILRRKPDARVIIVSMLPRHDPLVGDAIGQGAVGYVEKPLRREQIATIMQDVDREFRPTRRIR
jgi:DNA-binding NarL/FixJ family response regulator